MTSSKKTKSDNSTGLWGFFKYIQPVLGEFRQANDAQKACILAMLLVSAITLVFGGLYSRLLPAWTILIIFLVGSLLIFFAAGILLYQNHIENKTLQNQNQALQQQNQSLLLTAAEYEQKIAENKCRHIPVYPPGKKTRSSIKKVLAEIRSDFLAFIRVKHEGIQDDEIRANIFLLSSVSENGSGSSKWKLIIHKDFGISMNYMPEFNLKLLVGQGASGFAFKTGDYTLTRRETENTKLIGGWEHRFQMTTELNNSVHQRLNWILSFPLLVPDTRDAIGVLNLDSLSDVPIKDEDLHYFAKHVDEKVQQIAKNLFLRPSHCIRNHDLGGLVYE